MRTAVITVAVTVHNVPDHITDQQVLDRLTGLVGFNSLPWPEPRSYVASARLVQAATAPAETPAPVSGETA